MLEAQGAYTQCAMDALGSPHGTTPYPQTLLGK
jgi:hypothetical protein